MANPYKMLHLPPDATPDQIEDAYNRMRRRVSHGGPGERVSEREVDTAYAVLSDPLRRSRIDAAIRMRRGPRGQTPSAAGAAAGRSAAPRRRAGFYARVLRLIPFL